ncbi:MAG: hypothetical protein IJ558_12020 [Treponema sp.]|nr:hypothetical protein [Treponema sp.]
MSGGSLDYFCYKFDDPIATISREIKWGKNKWSPETLLEFQNAIKYLKIAQTYSRRVEWLLSGDDGEDDFAERLKEELEALEKNPEIIVPQLKKCSLCKEFTGKECKHRWRLEHMYLDHPDWKQIDKESYEKRLTDASDCYDFEEIIDDEEE